MKRVLILIALAASLSACVSILPKQPPAPLIYPLEATAPGAPSAAAPKDVVIGVAAPSTPRTLSGSDIMWTEHGRLAAVDRASWDGRTPALLQRLLVLTIDRAGQARGAVRAGDARTDSEINWDVIAFGIVEDGTSLEARLSAHVDLLAPRDRRLLASLEVDERQPLSDRSAGAGAAALQAAARTASTKIAAWATEQTPLAAGPTPRP